MSDIVNVGLLSHQLVDGNLGCCALSYSNIAILDDCFRRIGKTPHYVFLVTDKIPQAKPSFLSASYEYRVFPGCMQTLKNPLRLLRSKCFDDCDVVFNLCGGDGYTDIYGFPRLLAESYMTLFAHHKGIPVVFSPQTIGPFSKPISKLVAQRTLSRLSHLFTRDELSTECCRSLLDSTPIDEVIDVAFALPFDRVERSASDIVRFGLNVSGLLFNGGYNRDNYFGLSMDYARFTRRLISAISQLPNVQIYLISHVIHRDPVEDDYAVCELLHREFPETFVAPRFSNPMEAKTFISSMDFFVGARMHATIAATSSGVPVVPIAYSRKVNGLYGTLEYPYFIDAKTETDEGHAVDRIINWFSNREELNECLESSRKVFEERLEIYRTHICEIGAEL